MRSGHAVWPLFETNALAALLFFSTIIAILLAESRQSAKTRAGASNEDKGSQAVVATSWLGGNVLAIVFNRVAPAADIHTHRVLVFGIALGILWCGTALRWWSFATLGQYFTFVVMTSADQQIITGGPYRFVRHPSYTGACLMLTGVGLAYGNWLSLAALAILPLIGIVYRIKVEERALLAAVGEDYRAYAMKKKRLIPYLW